MRVGEKKANARGRGRWKLRTFRTWAIGASAHGGGTLPDDTTNVTIHATLGDGVDLTTGTLLTVGFDLESDPEHIDALIGKLTDLRAHQRRTRGIK